MLLLNAGHEATVNAAGNGLLALLRHPHALEALAEKLLAAERYGDAIEAAAAWGELASADIESDGPFPVPDSGVVAPVMAIELLLGEVDGIEAGTPPGEPVIPDWAIEAVVEINLGQDVGLDAAYRQGGLLDDSVAAIWQRLASIATGSPEPTVFRASAYECARGEDFAPPGGFCP